MYYIPFVLFFLLCFVFIKAPMLSSETITFLALIAGAIGSGCLGVSFGISWRISTEYAWRHAKAKSRPVLHGYTVPNSEYFTLLEKAIEAGNSETHTVRTLGIT